tara:strand:+ start:132 stop:1922 length:1791 start_codon:yes stop_codon:yes gene_type:complete
MATKKTSVNYSARDFDSIQLELLQYAKRYYPETYKDFGEASFGSMTLDMVSYVGDMLSYYLDYQANEMFLDTAIEQNNVIRNAMSLGYKYEGQETSVGLVDFYILAPANSTGLGPDSNYLPIVKSGAIVTSKAGASFTVVDDIRFDYSQNEVAVAKTDSSTGLPTHYAVKATGQVVSGQNVTVNISIGAYEKYRRTKVSSANISEILSVTDSQGNEYYEVDYLSQDVIYKDVANRSSDSDKVSSILRPFSAARRFVVEKFQDGTYLQFGFGSESESTSPSVVAPSDMSLKLHGRDYTTATSFDPSKLLSTDKFGISPANTSLTVTYRENTSSNPNVPSLSINSIKNNSLQFKDSTSLSRDKMSDVEASIEASNSEPIVGSVTIPDNEEIRRRAKDVFATQNRAVTLSDLEAVTYMMPSKYGSIKRCKVIRSKDRKRSVDFYVLSEDANGQLIVPTSTIKQNLKMWLADKKMMNDTLAVKDAMIMNFGVEFSISVDPNKNKYEVLAAAMKALQSALKEPLYIGEPLYITDIYGILNKVSGVVDAKNVKITTKSGVGYSSTYVEINKLLSADGLAVEVPQNVALEVRYPTSDIKGSAT